MISKINNALKIAGEIGNEMNAKRISTMETGIVFCFLWTSFKNKEPQKAADIEKAVTSWIQRINK